MCKLGIGAILRAVALSEGNAVNPEGASQSGHLFCEIEITSCNYSRCWQQETMSIRTIQFTQEQARYLTGVSQGELRAWKKCVSYLAQKPGKAARFTYADLVGLSITAKMIASFHARISDIGAGVDALFRELSVARPAHLEGLIALIDGGSAKIVPASELSVENVRSPSFLVPCDPVLAEIGERMKPAVFTAEQTTLPFPPQAVKVLK